MSQLNGKSFGRTLVCEFVGMKLDSRFFTHRINHEVTSFSSMVLLVYRAEQVSVAKPKSEHRLWLAGTHLKLHSADLPTSAIYNGLLSNFVQLQSMIQ